MMMMMMMMMMVVVVVVVFVVVMLLLVTVVVMLVVVIICSQEMQRMHMCITGPRNTMFGMLPASVCRNLSQTLLVGSTTQTTSVARQTPTWATKWGLNGGEDACKCNPH